MRHRHLLGHRRHAHIQRLMGSTKDIWKLVLFIKCSKAMEKHTQDRAETDRAEETSGLDESWQATLATESGVG